MDVGVLMVYGGMEKAVVDVGDVLGAVQGV